MQIPPRPQELKLDGVEPCKLFTEAQLDQLKVVGKPRPRGSSTKYKAPACSLDVDRQEPRYSYVVYTITTEGFEQWLTGKRNAEAKLVTIEGFPAAEFHTLGVVDSDCAVAVGVAAGQQLHVEMTPITPGAFKQDQICKLSEQAAALAVQTLQTLR